MLRAASFSQFCLRIQTPLQSPIKICSSTSVNFHLSIPPLLVPKSFLKSPLTLPSSIPQQFFTSQQSTTKNIFPTSAIYPIQAVSRNQGTRESCKDWHSFNFVLLPQSMDSDDRAHNYLFLIVLARKIGLLQVVVSDVDACNWNSNHPVHPVSYPQPITITSIPY